jgi:hypothetical protein
VKKTAKDCSLSFTTVVTVPKIYFDRLLKGDERGYYDF